jgi:hypothetical protein
MKGREQGRKERKKGKKKKERKEKRNKNEGQRIEETFFRATKHAHVLESYDQMTGYFIVTNFTLNF